MTTNTMKTENKNTPRGAGWQKLRGKQLDAALANVDWRNLDTDETGHAVDALIAQDDRRIGFTTVRFRLRNDTLEQIQDHVRLEHEERDNPTARLEDVLLCLLQHGLCAKEKADREHDARRAH